MINTILNVDDICQDCPYFSTETNHISNYDGLHMIHISNYDGLHMIHISCEHHDLCKYLRKHIEKELIKND